ncbi:MAG: HU family DNA-binding protein [Candidatus Azobacteroides sp.]|nr:HU family DNA-binding protein [Candidatus Azobacteroides sp.]
MAAFYDFRENPNPRGDGKKQALHPRIVSKGVIGTEKLIDEITYGSSLTGSDIQAVLVALADRIADHLQDGYQVELNGIGKFSATLKARPVMDKKEIRSVSVSFDTITFRPAKSLRKNVRRGKVKRAPIGTSFKHSSFLPAEESKARLIEYLSKNPFITRVEYMKLTGKLKGMALQDLNGWIEKGYLKRNGKTNSSVYMPGDNYQSFTE